MKTLLLVDDERGVVESLRMILKDRYRILTASSGNKLWDHWKREKIDLVLLDILLPDANGIEILKEIKRKEPATEVIMVTALKTVQTAVEAMKCGASDYIVKPFDADEIRLLVEKILKARQRYGELRYLKSEIERVHPTDRIVAESRAMKKVMEKIRRVAPTNSTVLISGESGTGKELAARAIHRWSRRTAMPFVAVHCAAIPEGLLESELFGHEKGAFTGATSGREGRFELADGGTLFLDEISEMSLSTQVKILRVLQEKEFIRVGGSAHIQSDVRILAASNRDLRERIKKGKFREDLFYRLHVVPVFISPLRDRKEDIRPLVEHFLRWLAVELHTPPKKLSPEALQILESYPWPGNARELKNVLERSVALEPSVRVLEPSHLHLDWGTENREKDGAQCLEEAERRLKKEFILEALRKSSWNQTRAASNLGISRRKLKYRMDRLGIAAHRGKGRPGSKISRD